MPAAHCKQGGVCLRTPPALVNCRVGPFLQPTHMRNPTQFFGGNHIVSSAIVENKGHKLVQLAIKWARRLQSLLNGGGGSGKSPPSITQG